jgi:DNA-binding NarL/FixJ family response regulator
MFDCDRYGSRAPNERERSVIALVSRGLNNREVAANIGLSESVVKQCLRAIYDKLGLWNRVELALWYEAHFHGGVNVHHQTPGSSSQFGMD